MNVADFLKHVMPDGVPNRGRAIDVIERMSHHEFGDLCWQIKVLRMQYKPNCPVPTLDDVMDSDVKEFRDEETGELI
jgi:hypothetical protein